MGVDVQLTSVPEFDQLEIVKSSRVPYSYSGGTGATTTIAHNLGYTPIFIVFLGSGDTQNTAYFPLPFSTGLSVGASVAFSNWIYATADFTNLFINANYTAGSTLSGYFIQYYLLRQKSR